MKRSSESFSKKRRRKKPKISPTPTIGKGDWAIKSVEKTKNTGAASTVVLTFKNDQTATYTLETNRQTNECSELKPRNDRYHSGSFSVVKKMVPQCDTAKTIGTLAWKTPLALKDGDYARLSTEYTNILKNNPAGFFASQRRKSNSRPFAIMKYYDGMDLFDRQDQTLVNASSSYAFTKDNLHVNINLCIDFLKKAEELLQHKKFCDFKPENVMVSKDEKSIEIIDFEGLSATPAFIPQTLRTNNKVLRMLSPHCSMPLDIALPPGEKLIRDNLIKIIDCYAALKTALEFFIPFINPHQAMLIFDPPARIIMTPQLQQVIIENVLVHSKAQEIKEMLIDIYNAFDQQFLSIQGPFFTDSLSRLAATLTEIAATISSARSTPVQEVIPSEPQASP